MKRGALIVAALIVVGVGVWLVLVRSRGPASSADKSASLPEVQNTNGSVTASETPAVSQQGTVLLGETILRDYGRTNLPPENDLTLMSRLMENSLLLLKSAANRPLSANEDWADLFRGKNGAQERFLPDNHPALDAQGRLVDRWGVPLFFHAMGGGRYELRSAGPDKKLWTEDDIHRNANGSFRRGAALSSPSLMEAATNR